MDQELRLSTANRMPFLSGSPTHFRSVNATMNGALLSDFCASSWASNGVEAHATATATKNTLILSYPSSIFHLLQRIVNSFSTQLELDGISQSISCRCEVKAIERLHGENRAGPVTAL